MLQSSKRLVRAKLTTGQALRLGSLGTTLGGLGAGELFRSLEEPPKRDGRIAYSASCGATGLLRSKVDAGA